MSWLDWFKRWACSTYIDRIKSLETQLEECTGKVSQARVMIEQLEAEKQKLDKKLERYVDPCPQDVPAILKEILSHENIQSLPDLDKSRLWFDLAEACKESFVRKISRYVVAWKMLEDHFKGKYPGAELEFWDTRFTLTLDWQVPIELDWVRMLKYLPEIFDCDNFATLFSARMHSVWLLSNAPIVAGEVRNVYTGELLGYHAWNFIVIPLGEFYPDRYIIKGLEHVFYEPQTGDWSKDGVFTFDRPIKLVRPTGGAQSFIPSGVRVKYIPTIEIHVD